MGTLSARQRLVKTTTGPFFSLGQLVVRQDVYSQSYCDYSNFVGSVNVPANGIGPLDPNTTIGSAVWASAQRLVWTP
jgi:hypothetical protein